MSNQYTGEVKVGKTITAMYARKNFGQLLNEVSLLNETFVIERANRPMAALVPIGSAEGAGTRDSELSEAFRLLIKRIKGPRSKKLEKAIRDMADLIDYELEE